jgi:hypothetical protein
MIPKEPRLKIPREENASDKQTGLRDETELLLELIEEAERSNEDGEPKAPD